MKIRQARKISKNMQSGRFAAYSEGQREKACDVIIRRKCNHSQHFRWKRNDVYRNLGIR